MSAPSKRKGGPSTAKMLRDLFVRIVGSPVISAKPFPDGATIQLGREISRSDGSVRGEWYLWLRYVDWRLERLGAIVCGSSDEPTEKLADAFAGLIGERLKTVEVSETPAHDLILTFQKSRLLTFAAISEHGDDLWRLTMPEGDRVVLSSNGAAEIRKSKEKAPG